ncbi:MAG TPA: hypothetical protein VGF83_06625 [Actinomycetota bacterium]
MKSLNLSGAIALLVVTLAIVTAAQVQAQARRSTAPEAARGNTRLEKAAADVIAATQSYRAALEKVLAIHERELARRNELAELRQDLYERGVLSRREFEEGQRAQLEAQKSVEDTRRAMSDADRMMSEARTAESLARLAPLARGGYEETPGLVRYNGTAAWSLPGDLPRLQQFFLARFGRPLPISALGQTALHDRMGFDHRNALDVAVHPDSPEGRALMEHLRLAGIPFIAAWGAIPGSTSGAHIHVGQPSPRFTVQR